ncbi:MULTISPECIES: DUF5908 family protein [Aquimarina]|uniref:DUF5908 family protein n=1 Tax=Aquimarina TaxID=290174 RepID=UPI00041D2427|nr:MULTISPECIES: DUF5908 family protein [Aquimarina]
MGAIEIKELHIKINVDNDQKNTDAPKGDKPSGNKDMIVAECVEQIMEIISKQSER